MLFTLSAGAAAASAQGCADDLSGVTDLTAAWEAELLALTNAHRAGKGLVALQLDTTLTRASVWKARDMARRNYFGHDDPANGSASARSPWQRLTACGWSTGGSRAENIAVGYAAPAATVQGWIDSPGHRANIENAAMRYVGFGVANGASSQHGAYQVQMFASVPGPASTTPISLPPVDGGTGGGGGDRNPYLHDPSTDTPAATVVADPVARVTKTRCRSSLAVRGWCWRIVVSARVSSAQAARRTVVVTRRTASGRMVRVAALKTTAAGRAYRSVAIRPPARGTAAWLARNASSYRIAVAKTATANGATRTVRARVAR